MVVLATAIEPNADVRRIATMLTASIDTNNFLTEAHAKLRPVESPTAGVVLSGVCQGPKDIPETVAQAGAAAVKAIGLLAKDKLMTNPCTAKSDELLCNGCSQCANVCPYGAISYETKLINDHGTAPGAWFEDADGHCAALMPGVPREMKAMWAEQVRPILLKRQNCTIHSRTLRVLGGESAIASKVAPLFEAANPTAAIYCKTGECEIRVTAREATEQAAEAACNARIAEFKEILGAAAYDVDVPALEYTVVRALRERGLHAAAAESCTGGMIAERLTNVPGSSEVFGYGFVTYAEAAKQKLLGVDAAVIEKYNVVSGPVAAAMAFGAARESGAELAVGITGLAGPGGALPGKPVGTVYLAGADTRTDTGYLMRLTLGGYQDRQIIRTRAALYALDMLRRMALGLDVPDSVRFTPETADRELDI